MPKTLIQQPRWLDRGTSGFDFFQAPVDQKDAILESTARLDGPSRRIATRGDEVFAVVGNQLRWSALAIWKEASGGQWSAGDQHEKSYKVLKMPTSRPILQISVSPSGDFLAVLTSHTCHICVLPGAEKLHSRDATPLKLRAFQVGPTAHVLEQSPLATALWHPLAPSGNGLVTITKDACVRLWELDSNNRNSFAEPAVAVDLKKLSNATSTREDFSASKFGANKGYSFDDVEMQVAAGCFGGQGKDDEDGWSSMTLWVAMTEGDVYALCPFLPTQFWTPASLLPSLTTSVVAKTRMMDQDGQATEAEKRVADQQCRWLAELDQQEPTVLPGASGAMEVYTRPERPGVVPKLQGPFQLSPEPDFGEITDIHVIAPQIDHEALYGEDEDDDEEYQKDEGLSIGILCLATSTNQIYICLNTEGVEAEWLPSKRARSRFQEEEETERELLLLETIDCSSAAGGSSQWPTLAESPADRYEVLATQPAGVFRLDLRQWIGRLEDELAASQKDAEGVSFRLDVLLDTASTTVERLTATLDGPQRISDASVTVADIETPGTFTILTSASHSPICTVVQSSTAPHPFYPATPEMVAPYAAIQARAAYQPSADFFKPSALPAQQNIWQKEAAGGARGDLHAEIRFSPWTLQRITDAHRLLSSETHDLGVAAAELYQRCQRMITEMKDQIDSIRTLSHRVDSVTGEDNFSESVVGQPDFVRGGRERIDARVQQSQQRTGELQQRVERLRAKCRNLGGRELSARERAFAAEVAATDRSLFPPAIIVAPTSPARLVKLENSELTTSTLSTSSLPAPPFAEEKSEDETIRARLAAIQDLHSHLLEQTASVQNTLDAAVSVETAPPSKATAFPNDYRNRKMAQVFGLLDRETAMIEAVAERLHRLQQQPV